MRWVSAVAVYMVAQVLVSQVFVWLAILAERFELYFYEELGWAFMVGAQLLASVYLYCTADLPAGSEILLELNLLFAAIYLPFQVFHLRAIRTHAQHDGRPQTAWTLARLGTGLRRSIEVKNRRADARSWGGSVGLVWMIGYWATLLPMWVYYVVLVLARS
jgi:hypothetical protein